MNRKNLKIQTPKPKKQNKNLGPGEYENTLNGWEFCRGKERFHKFNLGGMSRYGSSGGTTVDTILNNFDPNFHLPKQRCY